MLVYMLVNLVQVDKDSIKNNKQHAHALSKKTQEGSWRCTPKGHLLNGWIVAQVAKVSSKTRLSGRWEGMEEMLSTINFKSGTFLEIMEIQLRKSHVPTFIYAYTHQPEIWTSYQKWSKTQISTCVTTF
jgi:hypothetical protein